MMAYARFVVTHMKAPPEEAASALVRDVLLAMLTLLALNFQEPTNCSRKPTTREHVEKFK